MFLPWVEDFQSHAFTCDTFSLPYALFARFQHLSHECRRRRRLHAVPFTSHLILHDFMAMGMHDGSLPYDTLIIATGASHQYFGHDEWAQTVPGLKTIADALEIRRLAHRVFHTCWPEKNRWEGMDCKVSVERPQPATSVVPQTPTWRIGSTIKGL